jgi:hypothetical protein
MKKEIKKPAIAFCALLDGIFTSCDLYNNEQVLNLLNEAYKASEEIKEEKSNVIYINRPIETR